MYSLLFLLPFEVATAKNTISTNLNLENTINLGYKAGQGANVELKHRNKYFGAKGYSTLTNEEKLKAENGYTYDIGVEIRAYLKDFFIALGKSYGGYKSTFSDGRVWEKSAHHTNYSIGYDRDSLEIILTYSNKENQTPNKREEISFFGEYRLPLKNNIIINIPVKLSIIRYDQSGKRMTGSSLSAGVGLKYEF
ncbi:MAG: hypothetical protein ACETWK_08020 [Candidatus Aminicenantaceae bacterium]